MPAKSFNKLVIAVSGTFPGLKQGLFQAVVPRMLGVKIELTCHSTAAADLRKIVESQGATFSATVGADCTHLVTTQKEVEKNSTKCELTPHTGLLSVLLAYLASNISPASLWDPEV
jgi:poly [ADP-ribose] polymerase